MVIRCPVKHAVETFYQSYPAPRLWVGFSGGMDSTVLLHALARFKPPSVVLTALHIHHGLQPQADQWLVHCKSRAESWGIGFMARHVTVESGQNIEAAARKARYAMFGCLVSDGEAIATAHHQRDQAETFLLNLMRGAGVSGLAAMPEKRRLKNNGASLSWLVRPFLNLGYEALLDYAQRYQLDWIEDPMNQQQDFRRNFIRHQILPTFNQAWSQAAQKVAQAANHCFEADQLLMQLAQIDLATVAHDKSRFDWQALQAFDTSRQKNLLRFWFYHFHGCRLNQADLDWFPQSCFSASPEASPSRLIAGKMARRYLNFVYYPVEKKQPFMFDWSEGLSLEQFNIRLETAQGEGVAVHWLSPINRVQIRGLQPSDKIKRSALKKWFQQHKIAPWQREHWPVLLINGELAAIRDYTVLPPFSAKQDETGVKFVALN